MKLSVANWIVWTSITLMAGCGNLANVKPELRASEYSSFANKMSMADQLINENRLSDAELLAKELRSSFPPKDEKYYTGAYYWDAVVVESFLAYIELIAGDPISAQSRYLSAFETFQNDELQHWLLLKKSVSDFTNFGLFLAMSGSYANQLDSKTGRLPSVLFVDIVREESLANMERGQTLSTSDILGDGSIAYDGVRINPIPVTGPLFHIGKLYLKSGGWCTASLIGERLALTNQHCVINSEGVPSVVGATLRFESPRHPDAVTVIDYETPKTSEKVDKLNDWAILKLDRHPYGRGYLGVSTEEKKLVKGSKIILAGFSSDLNEGQFLTADWGCTLRSRVVKNQSVPTNCKGWSGSSGSPVLLYDEFTEKALLVGVHWGRSSSGHTRFFVPASQFSKHVLMARQGAEK